MDTNVTTVAKATMADMIAAIWFGLGFKPSESLVLAGLEGPRNRLGVTLRVDLPDAGVSRSRQRKMIRSCLQTILASPADSVLVLVASETALSEPVPKIVALLEQEAKVGHLAVFDVIGITPTGYRSVRCRDDRCCPRAGLPIVAVLSSRAAAMHVLNGDTVVDSERDLVADVRPDVEPALVPGGTGLAFRSRPEPEPLSPAERVHWWQAWSSARKAAAVVDAQDVGAVAVGAEDGGGGGGGGGGGVALRGLSGALYDPDLRDTVLMDLLGAPEPQLWAILAGQSPAALLGDGEQQPHLATLLATPPDQHGLAAGEKLIAAAARVAAAGDRAPALAVLAMLAWYQGKGGRSRLLVQQARDDCPTLSLTRLVDDLLLSRARPPWMRNC